MKVIREHVIIQRICQIVLAGSFIGLLMSAIPAAFAESLNEEAQSLQQLQQLEQLRAKGAKSTSVSKETQAIHKVEAPHQAQATIPRQQMKQSILHDDSQESALQKEAFMNMTQQQLPLTPSQIHKLKKLFHESKFATDASVDTPPRPNATSKQVNLDPGSTPPVIRLSAGFVSSLVFLDSTGASWPIKSYDLGNPKAFDIQWDKESNKLMIQAVSYYKYGNLAVILKGLDTPVMLTLIPAQKAVDYRVDLRVQGLGPNAHRLPVENNIPPAENKTLLSVLDGVPPHDAHALDVADELAEAWEVGDKMYLRTRMKLLSPGYLSTLSSADGMNVYYLQKSPLILVSHNGKIQQLKIQGFS